MTGTELNYANPTLLVERAKVEPGEVIWKSPSNLALIKYWGKYGRQLPRNPSISFTLENAFTATRLKYQAREDGGNDIALDFYFNEEPNEAFRKKVQTFFESITDIFPFLRQLHFTIHTTNSFPHSAGIASSASAMSALALCLCSTEDELFGTLSEDTAFDQKASFVARLGSGSASRSIYPHLAVWGKTGEIPTSSDLYAVPAGNLVHDNFKAFHDDILIVSDRDKSVSSTAGHQLMEGNSYADARYQQARQRFQYLMSALRSGDYEAFGEIVENEALTLHAMMMASNPSYMLLEPGTITLIRKLRQYRKETSNPVYFSLDAGPNLHVLYPESHMHDVRPWIEAELLPHCQDQTMIADWVGEGPVQI